MLFKWLHEIEGYENILGYKICNNGDIISVRRGKDKVLKKPMNKKGYLTCNIKDIRGNSIHRLVGKAFIPNHDNKPQVNHIDGNKLNNDVSNLEWITCSENIYHAFQNGLMSGHKKEKNYQWTGNHSNCKSVDMYDENDKYVKSFNSMAIASREMNINLNHIYRSVKGFKSKKYKFSFKMKEGNEK